MGNTQINANSQNTAREKKPQEPLVLDIKTSSITDDYYLLTDKELGQCMSARRVIRCKRKETGQNYALKIIEDNANTRHRIQIQWRASYDFGHIVKIVDVYENKIEFDKYFFIVMEYMKGGQLLNTIRNRNLKKAFTEFEVAQIMHQIGTIVEHLHSMGIAHLDLKPEKLLMVAKGDENYKIKLCDFGHANYSESSLISVRQKSCDILSMGVIMYILCCGCPPAGNKEGIERGELLFESREWEWVSSQAKELMRGMLATTVEKRKLSIGDIMTSEWMENYADSDLKKRILDTVPNLQKKDSMANIRDFFDFCLEDLRCKTKVEVTSQPHMENKLYRRRELKRSIEEKKRRLEALELEEVQMKERQETECQELKRRHEKERKELEQRQQEFLNSSAYRL